MKRLIELENITAGYDRKIVLKQVSLTIWEDDFLGIIGPNGGGKTTLLKVILGLLRPQEGTVRSRRSAGQRIENWLSSADELDRS